MSRRLSPRLAPAGLLAAAFLVPAASPARAVPLQESIARSLSVLSGDSSLSSNPRSRLQCMLGMLRGSGSADDRYLNGHNYLVKQQEARMNDEQFNLIVDRVRRDLQRDVAFGGERSDAEIVESLRLLDDRIFQGIAYLNRVAGDGLAVGGGSSVSPGKIQMKDFIANNQGNRSSVYWCYGEGQD